MQKKRDGGEQELLTDNWKEILEDDEISVVIEVMGGLEPAKTMILEALEAGKNAARRHEANFKSGLHNHTNQNSIAS